jgi:simple sugar transport system ATP-binding protein
MADGTIEHGEMPAGRGELPGQPVVTVPPAAVELPRAGAAEAAPPEVRTVELRDISKSFRGVWALRNVSFHLRPGEVVGLVGDNGAGKSTLIKILTGVHRPDEGAIFFNGRPVTDLTVQRARRMGIETVYQERALADDLPLWRNIFMGRTLTGPLGFLKVAEMRRVTAELMRESMGFTSAALTPDTSVAGLSGGERQGLAIVRALHFQANIIVLDEPTMGLSLKETEKVLGFARGIRAAGKSCVFIDHNMFHVHTVADRIVVIDRGRVAGEFPTSKYSLNELVEVMREIAATGTYGGSAQGMATTEPGQ